MNKITEEIMNIARMTNSVTWCTDHDGMIPYTGWDDIDDNYFASVQQLCYKHGCVKKIMEMCDFLTIAAIAYDVPQYNVVQEFPNS